VFKSDVELVEQCQVIISILPPRDAVATALRIVDALPPRSVASEPLYFIDMNAIAPSTSQSIAALFEKASQPVRFIDGGVIGGPPSLKTAPDAGTNVSGTFDTDAEWNRPSIPTSGPYKLSDCPGIGKDLCDVLNINHIADTIGSASGLKMCFASMSKGFTAIAIQAFTTAQNLGVLEHLKDEMSKRVPNHYRSAERGVATMPPKAYRWVREMEEISKTHSEEGGFEPYLFQGAAGVYKSVAEDTVLGEEKVGKRKRGQTVDDVALAMSEGLQKKKKKND
jgi:hypothetical protein